ncbi:MAG: uracil phosphoribosyltransferase [Erysipelotrichaceae bacterium]|nr:uracil phosphoribosyltransferase [Erysipelotrichaceae bacterium]
MENVHVIDHPLIQDIIARMRDKNTAPALFHELVKEVAILEAYEALRDIPTKSIEVETPLEKTEQHVIDENNICLVPILRAGLGMAEGVSILLPGAPVGHIGLKRDEVTHLTHEYYANFPKRIADMDVLLLDPMLATGGSAVDAITRLKERGVKSIRFLCIIAVPEGVKVVQEKFPDVPIYIGALDRELNSNAYILPGLGDAGDRIFGTID